VALSTDELRKLQLRLDELESVLARLSRDFRYGLITGDRLANKVVGTKKIDDGAVTGQKIASQSITLPKFATGIRPVQLVDSLPELPDDSYPEGAVVFLKTASKLFRSTGTAWTAAVAAADVTGELDTNQIADFAITDMKLAAGSITEGKTNWQTHLLY